MNLKVALLGEGSQRVQRHLMSQDQHSKFPPDVTAPPVPSHPRTTHRRTCGQLWRWCFLGDGDRGDHLLGN